MITSEDFVRRCGCRSAGECLCNPFVGMQALEKLVKVFGKEMVRKLRQKMWEGRGGWDDPKIREFLKASLKEHIEKGDMVDVANIAMFIWNIDH